MSLVASIDSLATRVGQECKGLRNDLCGKADAVHGHAIANTTGLQQALDGKVDQSQSIAYSIALG